MKGDFSRSTFRPERHYASVRMQQGRAWLDADWNEQADIQTHLLEAVVRDVIGRCGGPGEEAGFAIVTDPQTLPDKERKRLGARGVLPLGPGDFLLSEGRYYVQGILCENESVVAFSGQPSLPDQEPLEQGHHLVYLDVWRRHITSVEDPEIREVALGGPDTATRLQTVCQVKALPLPEKARGSRCSSEVPGWNELIEGTTGQLAARTGPASGADPRDGPPGGGYRGTENRLYRVEIHDPGLSGDATFKWSRHNGSVVFSVTGVEGNTATVSNLGTDGRPALHVGDWVEFVDDAYILTGRARPLLKVTEVDIATAGVTLSAGPAAGLGDDLANHPLLRRWDRDETRGTSSGTIPVVHGAWLDLEDGVQVMFEYGEVRTPYQTGDYWLIPARMTTADLEWPEDEAGVPLAHPPHGVRHHYCRLGVVAFDGRKAEVVEDCRHLFPAATSRTGH